MIFFNSSMPRSGSTLLQNVLAQNTEIFATPTDGSLELLYGARMNYMSCPEFKAQDRIAMQNAWRAFCRGGLLAYADSLKGGKQHICIKCRGIGVHYDWYSRFLGEPPKVICMVRDIRAILSSMEKIFRQQQERHQPIQDHFKMAGTTTEKRVQDWLRSPPVGMALERFGQMRLEGTAKKCLFIRYEDFCSRPQEQMELVYGYLGLPVFTHNFDRIEQITVEDDEVYGLSQNLHKISGKITPASHDHMTVLGKGLSKWAGNACLEYQEAYGYQ